MATHALPQIAPRCFGERCRDAGARPSMTMAEAERATADLAILAHPVRMQLLDVLARKEEGTICVCDLEAAVLVKQPTVSHYLKLLREAGLVHAQREEGLYVYYRVE